MGLNLGGELLVILAVSIEVLEAVTVILGTQGLVCEDVEGGLGLEAVLSATFIDARRVITDQDRGSAGNSMQNRACK